MRKIPAGKRERFLLGSKEERKLPVGKLGSFPVGSDVASQWEMMQLHGGMGLTNRRGPLGLTNRGWG